MRAAFRNDNGILDLHDDGELANALVSVGIEVWAPDKLPLPGCWDEACCTCGNWDGCEVLSEGLVT